MNFRIYIHFSLILFIISRDPESTEPESDCEIMSPYLIAKNETNETHIYNISPLPPREIKNGTLENDFLDRAINVGLK